MKLGVLGPEPQIAVGGLSLSSTVSDDRARPHLASDGGTARPRPSHLVNPSCDRSRHSATTEDEPDRQARQLDRVRIRAAAPPRAHLGYVIRSRPSNADRRRDRAGATASAWRAIFQWNHAVGREGQAALGWEDGRPRGRCAARPALGEFDPASFLVAEHHALKRVRLLDQGPIVLLPNLGFGDHFWEA